MAASRCPQRVGQTALIETMSAVQSWRSQTWEGWRGVSAPTGLMSSQPTGSRAWFALGLQAAPLTLPVPFAGPTPWHSKLGRQPLAAWA